jgi:hypothetical protein
MPKEPLVVMPVALTELPPPSTTRWVARRKAAVVAAVHDGVLTREEACRRYRISMEEFASWQRLADRHGLPGLRATHMQEYRRSDGATDSCAHSGASSDETGLPEAKLKG